MFRGIDVSDCKSASDAIVKAGLNWNVGLSESFINFNGEWIPDGWKSVVRETDGKTLGKVKSYTPLQNEMAFRYLDPLIQSGKISLDSAGSLNDGEIIYVLGKFGEMEVKDGDSVRNYLIFGNGHNRITPCNIKDTDIRPICQNTLMAALRSKNAINYNIRHCSNLDARIKLAIKAIDEAIILQKEKLEVFQAMAQTAINDSKFEEYAKSIFCKVLEETENRIEREAVAVSLLPKTMEDESRAIVSELLGNQKQEREELGEILTSSYVEKEKKLPRAVELVTEAYHNAPGADPGTVWGAYNAVTYYLDNIKGRSENSRQFNSWFGSSVPIRQKAFNNAVSLIS